MKPGDRGEEVKAVQELLRANGHQIAADGIWGPRSVEALRTFQRAQGLRVTGQPDEATMAALRGEIQTPRTVPTIGGFGLWVDDLPERRGGVWGWDRWARELVDTGASNFSLVTFGQPTLAIPDWWTAERLAAAAAALRHAGLRAGNPRASVGSSGPTRGAMPKASRSTSGSWRTRPSTTGCTCPTT